MSMIKLKNVSKFYRNKTTISSGFTKINLELEMGEFVVITGESGSGKSTLLNVISGLDSYEEGEMYIDGEETSHFTEVDYENYRRKYIGNIFQHFNLVNSYTVYQNVELVLLLNGYKRKEARGKVLEIIKTVGLSKYINTKASKLSGGQKQRVAIARALAKDTPIIVADEPTGNLDVASAKAIMKLLKEISKDKLVVIVTHNYEQVEEYATRKISMNDGKIIEDKKFSKVPSVKAKEVEYKNVSGYNRFLLGFRNAFNIKTKFALLFLVYFFLTMLVFSEYSGLRKADYDEGLLGFNNYFVETDPKRIVLKKEDKTAFTEDDIDALSKLDNVESVYREDILLDTEGGLYSNDIYINGKIKPLSKLDVNLDEGVLPKNANEIVVVGHESSYYFNGFQGGIMGKILSLQENRGGEKIADVKVTGIKYDNEVDAFYEEYIIYVGEQILDKIKTAVQKMYSDTTLYLNDKEYGSDFSRLYFDIEALSGLAKGEAYLPNNFNIYCKDYNCESANFEVGVKNIYYSGHSNFKTKAILTKDNYKNLLKTNEAFDNFSNTIFISEEDYDELYARRDYQVSVFMSDAKKSEETEKLLKSKGYNAYLLKDNLFNPSAEFLGVLKIMRGVFFLIAAVALFFISYFIIKVETSTIRP